MNFCVFSLLAHVKNLTFTFIMSDKRKLGKANEKYIYVFVQFLICRPKVFSLSDIKDDSHSSDDEKQTFYAGGEKS